jgi:hypothetical protein
MPLGDDISRDISAIFKTTWNSRDEQRPAYDWLLPFRVR